MVRQTGRDRMLRRLNDALPELVLGILLYGIAVELAGVWFVADKIRYTTGLLVGIALAVGMAINMADHRKVDLTVSDRSGCVLCDDEV